MEADVSEVEADGEKAKGFCGCGLELGEIAKAFLGVLVDETIAGGAFFAGEVAGGRGARGYLIA